MNDRIRELIEQAEFEEKDGHISIQGVYMFNTTRMEKFAKLIVKECAHLVGGYTKENEFGTDVKEAYEEITKHFGVEQ